MPQVHVRFFAAARELLGESSRTVDARDLTSLLSTLGDGASEEARTVLARSSFLVNTVARTDHAQALAEGDSVDVLPPFAGG